LRNNQVVFKEQEVHLYPGFESSFLKDGIKQIMIPLNGSQIDPQKVHVQSRERPITGECAMIGIALLDDVPQPVAIVCDD